MMLAENPYTLFVDSGNACVAERQSLPAMQAMKLMGYSAVGVGSLEVPFFDQYLETAKKAGVPVLYVGADKKTRNAQSYIIKQVGSWRVGIVSFGGVAKNDEGKRDVEKRRNSALKDARSKSDVLVLLDNSGLVTEEWLKQNANKVAAPDIVIGGQKSQSLSQVQIVGKTRLVPTGMESKSIGILYVLQAPSGDLVITYGRSYLEEKIVEDPAVLKILGDYNVSEKKLAEELNAEFMRRTGSKTTGVIPHTPRGAFGVVGGEYHDSDTCKSCHKSQYDSWKSSKHAKAIANLEEKDRSLPTCVTCHSEKYRRTGASPVQNGKPGVGVECASCHIKVLPHGAEGPKAVLAGMKIDLGTCRTCHDTTQSPKFESEAKTYWDRAAAHKL